MKKKEVELDQGKRRFLKTAGKAAVTAPAVGLLLSVNSKAANAIAVDPYQQPQQTREEQLD